MNDTTDATDATALERVEIAATGELTATREVTATAEFGVLHLGSQLDIRNVQDAHRALLDSMAAAPQLIVDMSRVTVIDTAGVQLLVALANETRVAGRRFTLRGESVAIQRAFSALGPNWPIGVGTTHAS